LLLLIATAACGASALGCSSRTLVLVDSCNDGGVSCVQSGDALLPGDSSTLADAVDSSDGPSLAGLRQGLVGLWHLDDGSGSTVALDSSGKANHGTLSGLNATSAWVAGQLGGALETNGVGYALVARSPSIDSIVGQVTVAAWIYLEGTIVDFATAASRQIGTGLTQHYHLSLDQTGHPSAFINRGVPSDFYRFLNAPNPVVPMTWTHIAVTYDGAMASLYVDGAVVHSLPISGTFGPDTTPLVLGGNGNQQDVTERFPGRIDEIVLYNRALDPAEIRQLASGVLF
jgi:hypothetical protein